MSNNPNPSTYLGDGVYAEFDGEGIKLWTERLNERSLPTLGETVRHWIVLGPNEMRALKEFEAEIIERAKDDAL